MKLSYGKGSIISINYKNLLLQLLLVLCIVFGAMFQLSLMASNRGQAMAVYGIDLLMGILLISVTYLIGYYCFRYLNKKYWIWIVLVVQLFVLYDGLKHYYYYEVFDEIIGNPYVDDGHYPPGNLFYFSELVINLLLLTFCGLKLIKTKDEI